MAYVPSPPYGRNLGGHSVAGTPLPPWCYRPPPSTEACQTGGRGEPETRSNKGAPTTVYATAPEVSTRPSLTKSGSQALEKVGVPGGMVCDKGPQSQAPQVSAPPPRSYQPPATQSQQQQRQTTPTPLPQKAVQRPTAGRARPPLQQIHVPQRPGTSQQPSPVHQRPCHVASEESRSGSMVRWGKGHSKSSASPLQARSSSSLRPVPNHSSDNASSEHRVPLGQRTASSPRNLRLEEGRQGPAAGCSGVAAGAKSKSTQGLPFVSTADIAAANCASPRCASPGGPRLRGSSPPPRVTLGSVSPAATAPRQGAQNTPAHRPCGVAWGTGPSLGAGSNSRQTVPALQPSSNEARRPLGSGPIVSNDPPAQREAQAAGPPGSCPCLTEVQPSPSEIGYEDEPSSESNAAAEDDIWLDPVERIEYSDLEFTEHLGSGEFGQVCRGGYKGCEVAIKQLFWDDNLAPELVIKDLAKEIESFRHLRHKRLVRFIGACLELPHLCLVTEYMPGGSLHHLLHVRKLKLPLLHGANMCLQLAEGVMYLHAQTPCVVHRDLKSQNVVLDLQLNLKLCDFGLTESMERTHITKKNNGGSPRYMAPELFDSKTKITEKVDIWAMACIFSEIFGGALPYDNIQTLAELTREMLVNKRAPALPRNLPEPLKRVIRGCHNFDHRLRPSSRQVFDQLKEGKQRLRESGLL